MTQEQEKDRQTIKPRQFALSLSADDTQRFYDLAYSMGTTPAEILTGFVCDLIDGTQTRGSDERMYARQYFDRCRYGLFAQQTFLTWTLQNDRMEEIADLLQTAGYAAGDLTYYAEHPEEADPSIIADLKQEEAEAQQDIADLYREYTEDAERSREPAQELQEGIKAIRAYWQELEAMTTAGQ